VLLHVPRRVGNRPECGDAIAHRRVPNAPEKNLGDRAGRGFCHIAPTGRMFARTRYMRPIGPCVDCCARPQDGAVRALAAAADRHPSCPALCRASTPPGRSARGQVLNANSSKTGMAGTCPAMTTWSCARPPFKAPSSKYLLNRGNFLQAGLDVLSIFIEARSLWIGCGAHPRRTTGTDPCQARCHDARVGRAVADPMAVWLRTRVLLMSNSCCRSVFPGAGVRFPA
jgi:hypothetical protein